MLISQGQSSWYVDLEFALRRPHGGVKYLNNLIDEWGYFFLILVLKLILNEAICHPLNITCKSEYTMTKFILKMMVGPNIDFIWDKNWWLEYQGIPTETMWYFMVICKQTLE